MIRTCGSPPPDQCTIGPAVVSINCAARPVRAAIIVANEFFDCLPVRHFVRGPDGWHERLVGLDGEGRLCFGLAPDAEPGLAALGEPGQVFEAGVAAARLMTQLAARIAAQGGALLVIDYGYDTPGRGETLQAVKRHRFADPLRDPGEAEQGFGRAHTPNLLELPPSRPDCIGEKEQRRRVEGSPCESSQ